MKKLLNYVALILVIIPVVYILGRASLSYSGYCFEQARYLSDSEKIDLAINSVVRGYPPVVDLYEIEGEKTILVGRGTPKKPIMYRSIEHFKEVNQNCCDFVARGWKGYQTPFLNKILGMTSGYARIQYEVRYQDSDGDFVSTLVEPYVAVANCGHTWSGI